MTKCVHIPLLQSHDIVASVWSHSTVSQQHFNHSSSHDIVWSHNYVSTALQSHDIVASVWSHNYVSTALQSHDIVASVWSHNYVSTALQSHENNDKQ